MLMRDWWNSLQQCEEDGFNYKAFSVRSLHVKQITIKVNVLDYIHGFYYSCFSRKCVDDSSYEQEVDGCF